MVVWCKLGSLGSRCWDGIRNTKKLWKEKGRKQGLAGGWGIRAWGYWWVSCQPNRHVQGKDCPLEEPCIRQKLVGLCTTALLRHWLGANPDMRMTSVWKLSVNSTSCCQAVSPHVKENLSGASPGVPQCFKPPSFRVICYAAKLTNSYNCKGGWEI